MFRLCKPLQASAGPFGNYGRICKDASVQRDCGVATFSAHPLGSSMVWRSKTFLTASHHWAWLSNIVFTVMGSVADGNIVCTSIMAVADHHTQSSFPPCETPLVRPGIRSGLAMTRPRKGTRQGFLEHPSIPAARAT